MKKRMLGKGLAVAVILLFIGLAIQPSIATVKPDIENDVEPKDYLFQTIIDIANNPEVKNLIEKHRNDLLKVDIDRSVYRKIFFRNPRLLLSMLFTKPSMTIDYLDKCYNKGIQITNILGENKVLEILESVEVIYAEVIDKLNNIIKNDGELSDKIAILKEMNKDLKLDPPFMFKLILCAFLIPTSILIFIALVLLLIPMSILYILTEYISDKFYTIFGTLAFMGLILLIYGIICWGLTIQACGFY